MWRSELFRLQLRCSKALHRFWMRQLAIFGSARPPRPTVYPDPWNEKHRDLIGHLREQHLAGVEADDEAGVSLEIEMSRVIMLGAGAALGLSVNKVLESKATVVWWFWVAESLLVGSIAVSWLSLYLGTYIRRKRVQRKYAIYFGELDERISAVDQDRPPKYHNMLKGRHVAFELENRPRRLNDVLRVCSAALAGLGILLLLAALRSSVHPPETLPLRKSGPFTPVMATCRWVGCTVAPGQQKVTVRKKGYADWSRSMNIAGNAVCPIADLTAGSSLYVSTVRRKASQSFRCASLQPIGLPLRAERNPPIPHESAVWMGHPFLAPRVHVWAARCSAPAISTVESTSGKGQNRPRLLDESQM